MMNSLIVTTTTLAAGMSGLGMDPDIKSYLPMLLCLAGGVVMAILYAKFLRTTNSDEGADQVS